MSLKLKGNTGRSSQKPCNRHGRRKRKSTPAYKADRAYKLGNRLKRLGEEFSKIDPKELVDSGMFQGIELERQLRSAVSLAQWFDTYASYLRAQPRRPSEVSKPKSDGPVTHFSKPYNLRKYSHHDKK